MDVQFADGKLEQLEVDRHFTAGLSPALVKAFRRRLQEIRAAADERDFYAMKSMHFEKLAGARKHQHSMRLNEQYRLIIELGGSSPAKTVRVIGVEDYH